MKKSAFALCALLGLVWGSNFIFVKWATHSITPMQITWLRVLFGFIPVLAYALAKGALRWAHWRHIHHFVVMSLLATAVYYYAFAEGTALLPSGIAGMLGGAIPLFTFLCAWLFLRSEPLDGLKVFGIGLGFLGVLLIAQPWSVQGQVNPTGIGYMLFGSLCVGCSFVYARRFLSPLGLQPVALATYQIGLALVFLTLATPFDGLTKVFDDQRAWLGLTFGLGLLGTGFAYIAYYHIVETLGALAASSVTYIPPVVALLIGVYFGEPLSLSAGLAIVAILAGVACVQYSSRANALRLQREASHSA